MFQLRGYSKFKRSASYNAHTIGGIMRSLAASSDQPVLITVGAISRGSPQAAPWRNAGPARPHGPSLALSYSGVLIANCGLGSPVQPTYTKTNHRRSFLPVVPQFCELAWREVTALGLHALRPSSLGTTREIPGRCRWCSAAGNCQRPRAYVLASILKQRPREQPSGPTGTGLGLFKSCTGWGAWPWTCTAHAHRKNVFGGPDVANSPPVPPPRASRTPKTAWTNMVHAGRRVCVCLCTKGFMGGLQLPVCSSGVLGPLPWFVRTRGKRNCIRPGGALLCRRLRCKGLPSWGRTWRASRP